MTTNSGIIMDIADLTIEDLIPHRGRMILIDNIIHVDMQKATSQSIVNPHWPFFNGETVNPLILVELIAQTAGLCNGFERIHDRGMNSSQQGFIVGIKKSSFNIDDLYLNMEIVTYCENKFKYDNFRETYGVSKIGSQVVCETVLQLFKPDSE